MAAQCLLTIADPVQAGIQDAYKRCVVSAQPDEVPLFIADDRFALVVNGFFPVQPAHRREELLRTLLPHATIAVATEEDVVAHVMDTKSMLCLYGGDHHRSALATWCKETLPDTTLRFPKNLDK